MKHGSDYEPMEVASCHLPSSQKKTIKKFSQEGYFPAIIWTGHFIHKCQPTY